MMQRVKLISNALRYKLKIFSVIVLYSHIQLAYNLFAQEDIKFTHLFDNKYISTITCITQDSQGFMWFGTSNGLYRYDGVNLKQYVNNFKNNKSISDNYIQKIIEDRQGNLWIGTRNGLNLYNIDYNNFTQFYHEKNNNNSLPSNQVSDILEDSQGNLWIAAKYLCLFNRANSSFATFKVNLDDEYAENFGSVYSSFIFEDQKKNLWFCTWRDLYIFNRSTHQFTHYFSGEDLKIKNAEWYFRNNLLQDKSGTFWLAVNKYGLVSFQFNGKITNFNRNEFDKNNPKHISDYRLRESLLDNKGNIWLGSENGGLFFRNRKTGKLTCFTFDPDNEMSICSNSIWSIYEDKIGRIWFGTFKNGISIIDPYNEKFTTVSYSANHKKISNNNVSAFWVEETEDMWIGTDGGGLNYFNKQKNEYTHFKHDPNDIHSLSNDEILSLCKDINGNMWIGTWNGGINLLRKNGKNFIKYNNENSILTNNDVFALTSDKKGNIYIGTYGSGLCIYNIKNNKWKKFVNDAFNANSLINNRVYSLYIDKANNIWIGTFDAGLDMLQFDSKGNAKFTHYQSNQNDSNSISSNYVQTIFEDDDGYLWIGTLSGLNRLDIKNGTFKAYRIENGLPNDAIQGIINDNHDNLWISTLNGLSKYDKKKGTFRNYSSKDGLQSDQFNKNAIFKTNTGLIFLGGNKGFNFFHPDSLKDNPYPPKVILTDLKLFNKPVPIGGKSPLKKHISVTTEITLNSKQSVFTIDFAALSYTCPQKNQYAYKLEGLEDDWNYVGDQKSATYTSLNPGTYNFLVKSANNDGLWNEQGISLLKITVMPPFWNTWWFRTIVVLLVTGSALLFFLKRISYLKKQRIWLEKLVQERTCELAEKNEELEESIEEINLQKEELDTQKDSLEAANNTLEKQKEQILHQNIELAHHRNHLEILVEERTKELAHALKKAEESDKLKSSFLANMSHEIRTPMNAIIGFSSILSEQTLSDIERKESIDLIKKSCESLLILINDIIDLSKIQSQQLTMNLKPTNIFDILKELYKYMTPTANQKELELILNQDYTNNLLIIETDPERLKQVLSNMISNAIKYTDKGFVEFGIKSPINDYITFFIKDSGIGIAKEIENKIFGLFHKIETSTTNLHRGVGLGLPLCKSLTELLGGKIWYESEVGLGSVFYFTIPNKISVLQEKSEAKISFKLDLKDKILLIAEDQDSNYKVLNFYLQNTGAKTQWFINGEAIVNYIRNKGAADLILMDLKLPVMDGYTASKLIKDIRGDLPIIAQTAFAAEEENKENDLSLFADYLLKPIDKQDFFNSISKALKIQ